MWLRLFRNFDREIKIRASLIFLLVALFVILFVTRKMYLYLNKFSSLSKQLYSITEMLCA